MKSVYTTTITREAKRRGIRIEVIDPDTPIFMLRRGRRAVRCYNALTDKVGAATFHLANNKFSANRFLRSQGFPVPAQELYTTMKCALKFLARHGAIVVKPCMQWGGRGVSVAVRTAGELKAAIRRALAFEESVVLEQCVSGVDQRLILVNYRFVAAIQRTPATVTGNGRSTIRALIESRNRLTQKADPSHRIPVDAETRRNLKTFGLSLSIRPPAGRTVPVRLTSNYHTGGTVEIVTDQVAKPLIRMARKIARALRIPVIGIDMLVDEAAGRWWVIEVSPDLAISPPEGEEVARRFLDFLFP